MRHETLLWPTSLNTARMIVFFGRPNPGKEFAFDFSTFISMNGFLVQFEIRFVINTNLRYFDVLDVLTGISFYIHSPL